jgi:hypothetical protein
MKTLTDGSLDYLDPQTVDQALAQLKQDHSIEISWEEAQLQLVDGTSSVFIKAQVRSPKHTYITYRFTEESLAIQHCIRYAINLIPKKR